MVACLSLSWLLEVEGSFDWLVRLWWVRLVGLMEWAE